MTSMNGGHATARSYRPPCPAAVSLAPLYSQPPSLHPSQTPAQIVFSSSCTVYGVPEKVPITEDTTLKAVSPYGRTKLFQEDMFRDIAAGDKDWRILLLRCALAGGWV